MGERQAAEQAFHDAKYGAAPRKDFYAQGFTAPVFVHFFSCLGDVAGKRVLELGCGEGWLTRRLAREGAEVWSFDISAEAVSVARARLAGLVSRHPVHLEVMTAEQLKYADGFFDVVVGVAILHHLDLARALQEIARVLKPGGRGYFMEPLGHNLVLRAFRWLTPGRRSRDEQPLRESELDLFGRHFSRLEHREFFLAALAAAPLGFIGLGSAMLRARDLLCRLDALLLARFPGLWRQCWYSVIQVEK